MPAPTRHALSAAVDSTGAPPSSFRLFTRGTVRTSHGDFILDDAAAASVLAAAKLQGHRYVLDLEHGSLDGGRTDALAYFNVEMKSDGLYAVDVRWTNEGIERLTAKKQIFISPAFLTDDKKHITELVNCALTSQPATFNSQELVAASKYGRANSEMVGARVERIDAARFRRAAAKCGLTPGALLRACIKLTAKAPGKTPEDILKAIGEMLGLEDVSPAAVNDAVQSLFDEVPPVAGGDGEIDPTAASAPPAPAKLSKAEQAFCTKHKLTAAQFAAKKARALRKQQPARAAAAEPQPAAITPAHAAALAQIERQTRGEDAATPALLTVGTMSLSQLARARKANLSPDDFVARFNTLNMRRV